MHNIPGCRVDGQLQCLITEIRFPVPLNRSAVDIRTPHSDFGTIDIPVFYTLHVSDKDNIFFTVLFTV